MDNYESTINVISLFSGCGGLDLGVANASQRQLSTDLEDSLFNFVWSNDKMSHACKTLADNFGKEFVDDQAEYDQEGIAFCGDIREVDFTGITNKDINLMLGGFPCQDFSILRGDDDRQGVTVKRGQLYLEFVRGLAELQPEMFVAENVKGLVSANDGKAYERILKDFQNLNSSWAEIEEALEDKDTETDLDVVDSELTGYTMLHTDIVDFSALGVPQGRERLVLIGVRNDVAENLDAETLSAEITNNLQSQQKLAEYPVSTIEAFEGRTISHLDETYKQVMDQYKEYVDKLDSDRAIEYREDVWPNYTFNIWDDYVWRNNLDTEDSHNKMQVDATHKDVLSELGYWRDPLNEKEFDDGSNEEMREQSHVLERLRHIPPDENHKMVRDTEHHVSGMMSNIYRRLHPLQPSTTIIASGGGGTWGYHYERERGKLTNRERARIQSFPDDFLFTGKNAEVRKQIGNAVPPLGAKRVGEEVLAVFETITER